MPPGKPGPGPHAAALPRRCPNPMQQGRSSNLTDGKSRREGPETDAAGHLREKADVISWLDGFTQRQLLRVAASARRLRNRWLRTADGGAGQGGDPGIGQAIDVMQGDRGLLCGRERAHRRVERPGGGARCAVSAGPARVPAVLLA